MKKIIVFFSGFFICACICLLIWRFDIVPKIDNAFNLGMISGEALIIGNYLKKVNEEKDIYPMLEYDICLVQFTMMDRFNQYKDSSYKNAAYIVVAPAIDQSLNFIKGKKITSLDQCNDYIETRYK